MRRYSQSSTAQGSLPSPSLARDESTLSSNASLASSQSGVLVRENSRIRVAEGVAVEDYPIEFNELLTRPEFKAAIQTNLRSGRTIDRIYEGTTKLADPHSPKQKKFNKFILSMPPGLQPFNEICGDSVLLKEWLRQILSWSLTLQLDEKINLRPELDAVLNPKYADAKQLTTVSHAQNKSSIADKLLCHSLITNHAHFGTAKEDKSLPKDHPHNRANHNKYIHGKQIVDAVLRNWANAEKDDKALQMLRIRAIPATPDIIDTLFKDAWQESVKKEEAAPNTSRDPDILANEKSGLAFPPTLKPTPLLRRIKAWIARHGKKVCAFTFIIGLALTLIDPGGKLGMSTMWWSVGAMALSMQLGTAATVSTMPKQRRMKLLILGGLLFAAGCILLAFPGTQVVGLILMSFGSAFINAAARKEVSNAFSWKAVIPEIISIFLTLAAFVIPPLGIIKAISDTLNLVAPVAETTAECLSNGAITVFCINLIGLFVNGVSALVAWIKGTSAAVAPAAPMSSPQPLTDGSSPTSESHHRHSRTLTQSSRAVTTHSASFTGDGATTLATTREEIMTWGSLMLLPQKIATGLAQAVPDEKILRNDIDMLVGGLNSFKFSTAVGTIELSTVLRVTFINQPSLQSKFANIFSNVDETDSIVSFREALIILNSPVHAPAHVTQVTDGSPTITAVQQQFA